MSRERVGAAVRRITARLADVGIASARLDAELLVGHALGVDRTRLFLHPDQPLSDAQARTLAGLEQRRAEDRESIAHLLGVRGFRYLDLAVDRRALIPRPETELLVEVGLELPRGATVVDVGTGSGAIALALAHERPDLIVHATDVSSDALALARENAARLGLAVSFHEGDLLAEALGDVTAGADAEGKGADAEADSHETRADRELRAEADRGTGRASGDPHVPRADRELRAEAYTSVDRGAPFLAVLSNPPYIPLGDHDALPPEVREHDPHLALFGGEDGLDVVRRLVVVAREARADLVAIEIGQGQAPATAELLRHAGFATTEIRDDLAGIGRVVVGWSAGA